MTKSNGYPAPYDLWLAQNTGIPTFYEGDGTSLATVSGTAGPKAGIWQHIAVTYDGTTVTHYLNGATNGSGTATAAQGNLGQALRIGSRTSGDIFMNGGMDDVRIYNRVLSQAEIQRLYAGSQPAGYDQSAKTYLKLDEGAGSATANSLLAPGTSNVNSGTLGNFTLDGTTNGWVAGHTGNGLLFNGSGEYVSTPSITLPNSFTYSAWVNASSVSAGYHSIIRSDNFSPAFSLYRNGNQFFFYNAANNNIASSTISSGTWYHVVGTYDGATKRLYVNGALASSQTINVSAAATSSFKVGADNFSQYFDGTIDDVRLYSTALSADEVSSLYSGTAPAAEASSLMLYWNLNESSGTTAADASTNAIRLSGWLFDGTDGWTSGVFGNALLFKQSNVDYIALPDQGLTKGSVEMWLNPTTITGDQRLFSQGSGATTQAGMLALNQSSGENGSLWVWDGTAWQRLSDTGSLTAGSWNHVVVDYSGSSATAFVNGTQAPYTVPTAFAFSGVGVSLGGKSFGSGGSTYNGAMDDVRVSSAILQDYEVADHYRLGL